MKDASSSRFVGEVVHRGAHWSPGDPIETYLCIRLQSGKVLEAVGPRSDPEVLAFYLAGDPFGRFVEKELPPPKSWWKRIFAGERLWHVFLRDEFVGVLQFNYPVSNSSVLHLQLHNGTILPISAGTRWFHPETKFLIPPQSPPAADADVDNLHFFVSAVMRLHIFSMDVS